MDRLEVNVQLFIFLSKYLVKDGGPIKEILVSKAIITKTNNGFEAACSLSDAIKKKFPKTNYIYGNQMEVA